MPATLAQIRRQIAQNVGYWGGDVGNGGPGTVGTGSSATTLVDTTRPEPDDFWDNGWVVLNPGSTDQVNNPTVWRAVSSWIQASGTFTIFGTWPAPYATNGPTAGVTYEVYNVFRPEQWAGAINWALRNSYPERHQRITFEFPENVSSKVINWGELVKSKQVNAPVGAPTVSIGPTQNGNGTPWGTFLAGVYQVAYTYYNDVGETLISPTASVTLPVPGTINIGPFASVPAEASGVRIYASMQPGSATLGGMNTGDSSWPLSFTPNGHERAVNYGGVVDALVMVNAPGQDAKSVPAYNTTTMDIADLASVEVRINPDQYPEIWVDLGADLWKPLGGDAIQLDYRVTGAYHVRFICKAFIPPMSNESDSTTEPLDVLYSGAEVFLWDNLIRQSPAQAAVFQPLLKDAQQRFDDKKKDYMLDPPHKEFHRPRIMTGYPGNWLG